METKWRRTDLRKTDSYFSQNTNLLYSEFPPIPLKDFDLKHVNATDVFLGCYFLEPIGAFCLHSVQKKNQLVFSFTHRLASSRPGPFLEHFSPSLHAALGPG